MQSLFRELLQSVTICNRLAPSLFSQFFPVNIGDHDAVY